MGESQCPMCGHAVSGFETQEFEARQDEDASLRAENERLRAALNEAQRLLSVCSFDAPEDLADLEMIDAALSTKD